VKPDFGKEDLILKAISERLLEAADTLDHPSSYQDAAQSRRGDLQEVRQERWRRDQSVGSDPQLLHAVAALVFGSARPAVPVLGRAADHGGVRMRLQDGYLALQLIW
jgi:hypothetical protein